MDRFFCYIIVLNEEIDNKEIKITRSYIGYTVNPYNRIRQHNQIIKGGAKATKISNNWEYLFIIEGFKTSNDALCCEWKLKHPNNKKTSLEKKCDVFLSQDCTLSKNNEILEKKQKSLYQTCTGERYSPHKTGARLPSSLNKKILAMCDLFRPGNKFTNKCNLIDDQDQFIVYLNKKYKNNIKKLNLNFSNNVDIKEVDLIDNDFLKIFFKKNI